MDTCMEHIEQKGASKKSPKVKKKSYALGGD